MITVNAYSEPNGGFLFFAQPASALHAARLGPLLAWGVVTPNAKAGPGVWERVANDITRHGFARVSKSMGRQLLGMDTQAQCVDGLR